MPELLFVSALACAVMTAGLVRMLRPPRRSAAVVRALAAAAVAAAVVVPLGAVTGAETTSYLLASAFAAGPVSVLLGGAAQEVAPGRGGVAWALVLTWAGIVFPVASVVPPLVLAGCDASECRAEDFGGALALLVTSAAAVLPAWRAPSSGVREGWARFALPALVVWLAAVVWLASLEGVIDAYTPRILLAAVVAPAGGAAGWLLVDVLKGTPRHPVRSAADGALAGLVAIVPGVAGISFPWSLVVGVLAGAAAAVVYGSRRLSSGGRAGHWALVVLASTAIGYLAPAITGDTIGFVFTGRIAALLPPVAAFASAAALGLVLSVPSWLLARDARRAPDATAPRNEKTPG